MARRVGLVGAGYICEYHQKALQGVPGVTLAGVFDVDQERAAKTGLTVYPSLASLCADVDVVHVLTPPSAHTAVALEALRLGCHVLVEKPLAEDVDDCERIRRLARERDLSVTVNHSLLFDPQVQRALARVRAGELGRIVGVDVLRSSEYPPYQGGALPPPYRSAGYPFRDLGVHGLYLVRAFLGPIEEVSAEWQSLGGDPNLAFDEWRALVKCRDGLGQVLLSWNARPLTSQLVVHGTRGSLRVDLFSMFQSRRASTPLPKAAERLLNAMSDALGPLVDMPPNVLRFLRKTIKPYQGLHNLVAEFYRSLDAGEPPPVGFDEAIEVVKFTEQVARAADRDHRNRMSQIAMSEEVPYLVTGASGALGSAIVDRLVERGERVRCFVRRISEPRAGVELALGDLGDPEAVSRAVRGARVVIHAGAAMKGGWTEHECATVKGTQHVVDACLRHGVDKLVHVSSMSVLDFAGAPDVMSEQTPYEPRPDERGAYTRAKLEAEQIVRDAVRRGLSAVVLRPGQIFGGRLPLLTPAVARRLGARFLVLGDGEVRLPLVYIADVVDAVMQAVEGPLGSGEIIQLVDDYTPTQNEVLALASGRVVRVPRNLLFWGGKLSEPLLAAVGRKSPFSRYRFESALAKKSFQSVHASLLAWRPRVGVRAGIDAERRAGRLA